MSNFTPKTELYGRNVKFLDRDGGLDGREGTLTRIHSPWGFSVNGKFWEVSESEDFFERDGQLYLRNPY